MKATAEKLQQASAKMAEELYKSGQEEAAAAGAANGNGASANGAGASTDGSDANAGESKGKDDDVIDADFKEV